MRHGCQLPAQDSCLSPVQTSGIHCLLLHNLQGSKHAQGYTGWVSCPSTTKDMSSSIMQTAVIVVAPCQAQRCQVTRLVTCWQTCAANLCCKPVLQTCAANLCCTKEHALLDPTFCPSQKGRVSTHTVPFLSAAPTPPCPGSDAPRPKQPGAQACSCNNAASCQNQNSVNHRPSWPTQSPCISMRCLTQAVLI